MQTWRVMARAPDGYRLEPQTRDEHPANYLHAEQAEAAFAEGGVEAGGKGEAEDAAGVGGVDDAVIPEARRGVVRVAFGLVEIADRLFEGLLLLGAPGAALALDAFALDRGRSEEHTLNSSHSQISYAVFC